MEENKKFSIEKIDEDTYKIVSLVNSKELTFKKNIELARKIQSVNANARLKMIQWMKDNSITKNDLIDKINKDGKIIYDETNYRSIEQGFIQDEAIELSMKIFDVLFHKSIEEIFIELGFNENDDTEALRLGTEIREIITKKNPS